MEIILVDPCNNGVTHSLKGLKSLILNYYYISMYNGLDYAYYKTTIDSLLTWVITKVSRKKNFCYERYKNDMKEWNKL